MKAQLIFLASLFTLCQAADINDSERNDILRQIVNSAAGVKNLIPENTHFELRQLNGITHHECKDFPGGGRGCVSGSVYTSNDPIVMDNGFQFSGSSTSRCTLGITMVTTIVIVFYTSALAF